MGVSSPIVVYISCCSDVGSMPIFYSLAHSPHMSPSMYEIVNGDVIPLSVLVPGPRYPLLLVSAAFYRCSIFSSFLITVVVDVAITSVGIIHTFAAAVVASQQPIAFGY